MQYLRLDDLSISMLSNTDSKPVLTSRTVLPGHFDTALAEFSAVANPGRLDVLVSGPTTIVPSAEIPEDPEEQALIFNSCFSFNDSTPRRVFFDEIPALKSHLFFAVKDNVCNAIIEQFPDAEVRFFSAITPMLRHFSENYDGATRFRVYLNCRNGFVDAFAFDGRQLAILNSFPVRSVSDAVYYALAFSKTVGFDVATTPYCIVGDETMATSIVEHLQDFAHNVVRGSLRDDFAASPLTLNNAIPYDLALHALCAL